MYEKWKGGEVSIWLGQIIVEFFNFFEEAKKHVICNSKFAQNWGMFWPGKTKSIYILFYLLEDVATVCEVGRVTGWVFILKEIHISVKSWALVDLSCLWWKPYTSKGVPSSSFDTSYLSWVKFYKRYYSNLMDPKLWPLCFLEGAFIESIL